MDSRAQAGSPVAQGTEHWTTKGDVKLFLWRAQPAGAATRGTVLFGHGPPRASPPALTYLHEILRLGRSASLSFGRMGV